MNFCPPLHLLCLPQTEQEDLESDSCVPRDVAPGEVVGVSVGDGVVGVGEPSPGRASLQVSPRVAAWRRCSQHASLHSDWAQSSPVAILPTPGRTSTTLGVLLPVLPPASRAVIVTSSRFI